MQEPLTPLPRYVVIHYNTIQYTIQYNSLLHGLRNHSINSNWSRMQLLVSSPELPLRNTSLLPCNSIGSLSNPALILRFYSSLLRSFITWTDPYRHTLLHSRILSYHSALYSICQPNHHGVKSFQPICPQPLEFSPTKHLHFWHCLCFQISPENKLIPRGLLCTSRII